MSLSAAIEQVVEDLRLVPGVDQVPSVPPAQLGDDRMIVVYAQPGESNPSAHTGRAGTPIIDDRDTVVVEYHKKIAISEMATALPAATDALDEVRLALWRGFNLDRFGHTVTRLISIRTDHFGEMIWGSDTNFGFRLLVDVVVTHDTI